MTDNLGKFIVAMFTAMAAITVYFLGELYWLLLGRLGNFPASTWDSYD